MDHRRMDAEFLKELLLQNTVCVIATRCLVWVKGKTPEGYGKTRYHPTLGAARDGTGYTHRLAWRLHVGPIPQGMTIDHVCFNRACCNVDHLQLLTPKENAARKSFLNGHGTYAKAKKRHDRKEDKHD